MELDTWYKGHCQKVFKSIKRWKCLWFSFVLFFSAEVGLVISYTLVIPLEQYENIPLTLMNLSKNLMGLIRISVLKSFNPTLKGLRSSSCRCMWMWSRRSVSISRQRGWSKCWKRSYGISGTSTSQNTPYVSRFLSTLDMKSFFQKPKE